MAGIYKFNSDNLTFDKLQSTIKSKFLKFFTGFSITLVVAVIINVVFSVYFDTPKERGLRLENKKMLSEYEKLEERFYQAKQVLDDIKKRDNSIYQTIFDAHPVNQRIEFASFGMYRKLDKYNNEEIVQVTSDKASDLVNQMKNQTTMINQIYKKTKNKEDFILSLPAIQPVYNPNLNRTAAGYGWKIHPVYKIKKFHDGIDFTAPLGSNVYATANGIVEKINNNAHVKDGRNILLNHGFGYQTYYAHLKEINVRNGQKIKRGDIIGFVGTTGLSTAPHLHYEVIKDSTKVNPVFYFFNELTPGQFNNIITIATTTGQSFD